MKTIASGLLIAVLAIAMAAAGFFVARSLRSQVAAMPMTPARSDVIGKAAPPLSVKALDGSVLDITKFRGRIVVLNFWASWCGPCVEEMPVLDRFARTHPEGFAVIGIAVEDEADARAFLQRLPVSYAIGFGSAASPDESAAFGNRLNVLPYSVLIDAQGIVRRAEARTFEDDELDAWVRW